MIRIKGLCRALDRVLEKVLDRQVIGDEEEVPQH